MYPNAQFLGHFLVSLFLCQVFPVPVASRDVLHGFFPRASDSSGDKR